MSSTESMFQVRRKLLPAAIVAALAAASPISAQAVAVAVSKSSYDVDFATGGGIGAGPPPPDDTSSSDGSDGPPSPGPGSSDVLFFGTIGDGIDGDILSPDGNVSVGIHTFGRANGSRFGSRSSGDVNGNNVDFLVDGDFELEFDLVNDDSFSFTIIPGQVFAEAAPSAGLAAGDFMRAEMLLNIEASSDGGATYTSVYASQASALVDSTGATVAWSGQDIGYDCDMGPTFTANASLAQCYIAGAAGSVDLGVVDDWDIRYTLHTETTGLISTDSGACGFGDGSGLRPQVFDGSGGGACRASAQIGDPLAFAAPEPASLGMAALGLLALRRARRKQTVESA